MKKGTKVIVSNEAPFHKGRVGYFQFYGEGESNGVAVCSNSAFEGKLGIDLFAVDKEFISECPKNYRPPPVYKG